MMNGNGNVTTQQRTSTEGTKITSKGLYALLEQQEFTCALTGERLKPENAVVDHIIPICEGGQNVLENVWWVTAAANTAKSTMQLDDFERLCLMVVRHRRLISGSLFANKNA